MTRQSGSGGDHLAKKSDIIKASQDLPPLHDILIVDDEAMDADRLQATLNLMFGYKLEIRLATTLSAALDQVLTKQPEFIFLDDHLKPTDTATDSIPYLRHSGFDGPIVIISSVATRSRRAELKSIGATEVIHKDDVDSVRLAETIAGILK